MIYLWTLGWLILVLCALGGIALARLDHRMEPAQAARVATTVALVGILVAIVILLLEPVTT